MLGFGESSEADRLRAAADGGKGTLSKRYGLCSPTATVK